MTSIYLLVLALTLLLALRSRGDFFAPATLYIIVYSSALIVYSFGLSRFQKPWSSTTVMLFAGATMMFLCGCWFISGVDAIGNPTRGFNYRAIRMTLHEDAADMNWNWFLLVWAACTALFFGSFLFAWCQVGGLPLFAEEPENARMEFVRSSLVIIYGWLLGPVSLMLSLEMILFGRLSLPRRVLVWAVSTVVALVYLSLLMRVDLLRLLLFGAVFFHYGKRRLSLRTIVVLLCAAVCLFLLAMLIRKDMAGLEMLRTSLRIRLPPKYLWFSNVYAYIVNNFWNFDYAVRTYIDGTGYYPISYGYNLFQPFLFAVGIHKPLMIAYNFDSPYNESASMIGGLNTILYIWHFYKDFGIFGAFVLPFLAGITMSKFYHGLIRFPTLLRVSLWGAIAGCIALSVMIPVWTFWSWLFTILFIVLAHGKKALPLRLQYSRLEDK